MRHDNPAERLLRIIVQGQTMSAAEKCRATWCELLKVGGERALYDRLSKVMALSEEVVEVIQEHHDPDPDLWSHWHHTLLNAFKAQNLNGQWSSFIGHIDAQCISGLKTSAALIKQNYNRSVLEQEQLDKYKTELAGVLDRILSDSSLNEKLKKELARGIRFLIEAIDEYFITGVDGIADASVALAGRTLAVPNVKEEIKKGGSISSLVSTLSVILNAVGAAEKLPALVHEAEKIVALLH
jgi:hypothetical protein